MDPLSIVLITILVVLVIALFRRKKQTTVGVENAVASTPGRSVVAPIATPAAASPDGDEIHRIGVRALQNPDAYGLTVRGEVPIVAPAEAGKWLISELREEAARTGAPLTEFEEWAAVHGPQDFNEEMRDAIVAFNNRAVALIRRRIEIFKLAGVPTLKVRSGLRIPVVWQANYEAVYQSELPWFISAVMQNVFFGNPAAGERKPWTSS